VSSLEARDVEPAAELGSQFLAEIREQPRALEGLLEHGEEFARVAATARKRGTTLVRMVGHGSSDNAASYGVYAFGILPRLTALRDSISLTVYYGTELDMSGSLVIGLSQSGRTPDVVEYVTRARRAGAFTVAITNDPDSDLATAAEALLPLGAGIERAVAATKTYVNTLAALVLLAAHMAGEGERCSEDLRAVIGQLDTVIPELEQRIPEVALPFAFVGRMFVIGRGVELSTAREIALKLLETCRIAAEPLTATVDSPVRSPLRTALRPRNLDRARMKANGVPTMIISANAIALVFNETTIASVTTFVPNPLIRSCSG